MTAFRPRRTTAPASRTRTRRTDGDDQGNACDSDDDNDGVPDDEDDCEGTPGESAVAPNGCTLGMSLPAAVRTSTIWIHPVVGDWDGDGADSVGIKLGTSWQLNNQNDSGPADITFDFGLANDLPLSWKQTAVPLRL